MEGYASAIRLEGEARGRVARDGIAASELGELRSVVAPCRVSVIVPAYQASRTLPASIASIRASTPSDTEVIVVDDGSFDDTLELARALADVTVGRPCQGGAARARNDGAHLARGEVLLFIDADVTVNRAAVEGALARVDGGADAVFGAYEALPPAEVRNFATTYKNMLHHYTHLQSAGPADTFWSGFGAVRRDAFFAVSGFDPGVTTGADVEDIHLGYRLRAAGFTIVLDPTLQVLHHKQYTVGGVIRSDVLHRAIPWTRAMLAMRTFHADLNLRQNSMVGAALALLVLGLTALSPWAGPSALGAAMVVLGAWLVAHRRILLYFRREWSNAGALGSAGMLFLYYVYGVLGTVLGTAAFVLRHERHPRLNWLRLDAGAEPPGGVAVTVAVVASPDEELAALGGLPEPAPWWELIVVGSAQPAELPAGARFLLADRGATRNDLRQMALDAAQGEMFATIDASCIPDPGWVDCVRSSAASAFVAVAGPFHHDRRGLRHRAAQVVRLWWWRPRPPAWIVNHPLNNSAFRTSVAQRLGGFHIEGALLLRLAGFGARPIRFVPGMAVRLAGPPSVVPFLRGVGGTARLRASAATRYHDTSLPHRLALVMWSPISALTHVGRIVRDSLREGSADRHLWFSMPLIVLGVAAHWAGRDLGLLRPAKRGGLVPGSEDDLDTLARGFASAPAVSSVAHDQ